MKTDTYKRGSNQTPTYLGIITKIITNRGELSTSPEIFVPDTGTTISVIPSEVARTHHLPIETIDQDNEILTDASGNRMQVIGTTSFYAKLQGFSSTKKISGLVVENCPDRDILIDWKTLKEWKVLPEHFPFPPRRAKMEHARKIFSEKVSMKE